MTRSWWVVSGRSAWEVGVSTGGSVLDVQVTVARDGEPVWSSRQPSWRPVSSGCAEGAAYVGAARSLVVLPDQPRGEPLVIDVDEDLILVFSTGADFVLVCETSVRLLVGRMEVSSIALPDVVERAHWDSDALIVTCAEGRVVRLLLKDGCLR